MTRRRLTRLDRRELLGADAQVLADLVRHAGSASDHYRAAAQAMGQLYMNADAHQLSALTRSLDEPMHRAADIERTFANLLHELQACTTQPVREPWKTPNDA